MLDLLYLNGAVRWRCGLRGSTRGEVLGERVQTRDGCPTMGETGYVFQ